MTEISCSPSDQYITTRPVKSGMNREKRRREFIGLPVHMYLPWRVIKRGPLNQFSTTLIYTTSRSPSTSQHGNTVVYMHFTQLIPIFPYSPAAIIPVTRDRTLPEIEDQLVGGLYDDIVHTNSLPRILANTLVSKRERKLTLVPLGGFVSHS